MKEKILLFIQTLWNMLPPLVQLVLILVAVIVVVVIVATPSPLDPGEADV